jgi:hypothetical protein
MIFLRRGAFLALAAFVFGAVFFAGFAGFFMPRC